MTWVVRVCFLSRLHGACLRKLARGMWGNLTGFLRRGCAFHFIKLLLLVWLHTSIQNWFEWYFQNWRSHKLEMINFSYMFIYKNMLHNIASGHISSQGRCVIFDWIFPKANFQMPSLNSNFAGKVKLTASALQECYKNL